MKKKDDPRYLRGLLRQCLDFWAHPDVQDMPRIDLFDEINRASNWRSKPEVTNVRKVQRQKVREHSTSDAHR